MDRTMAIRARSGIILDGCKLEWKMPSVADDQPLICWHPTGLSWDAPCPLQQGLGKMLWGVCCQCLSCIMPFPCQLHPPHSLQYHNPTFYSWFPVCLVDENKLTWAVAAPWSSKDYSFMKIPQFLLFPFITLGPGWNRYPVHALTFTVRVDTISANC